jgi:hypothetical protein
MDAKQEILELKAKCWDLVALYQRATPNERRAMGGASVEVFLEQQVKHYVRETHRICKD